MRGNTRMRFVLLPVAIVTLAVAAASGQRQPARPLVILVHGRGHLGDDTASLRRSWKQDLDSGLSTIQLPPLPDADVRLAFYADVLDPEFTEGCGPARDGDAMEEGFDTFTRDLFAGIASLLPKSEAPEARGLLGDVLYIADGSRRCAAGRRFGDAIELAAKEHRPIVVVAYSLGALVAYDYLNSPAAKDLSGVRFITLGSPLGVPEIRGILGHGSDALRMPPSVTDWDNVYDPSDAFAASIATRLSATSVRDRATRARATGDAHYIRHYLRDPATASAVAAALSR